jgi:hypothetical protein
MFKRWRARRLGRTLPVYQPRTESSHVLQVYGGDFPADAVATFMREGIAIGEVGLLVATPEHVAAVDALLGDVRAKVIYLDAAKTLDRILLHGRPDRLRFLDAVGDVVEQAANAGNSRVRAFGEMVALLCQRGEPRAAKELEDLWNELGVRHGLTLLCSYPVGAFAGLTSPYAMPLRDAHSHAIPA